VTLNVWRPVRKVSIDEPFAAVPEHPAVPAFSTPPVAPGVQEKLARATCPRVNLEPFAGLTIVADGLPGLVVVAFTV
jgi:hypothetical protein